MGRQNYIFYKDVEEEVETDAVKGGSYTKTDTVLWWYTKCSEEFAQRIADKYDDVWKQNVEFPFAYFDHDQIMEDANSSRSDLRDRAFDWRLDEDPSVLG